MKEFKINQNDANQRLDKFLSKAVKKLPKNLLYKYIRLKRIKVNGKRCEISTRLCEGDVISLYINDEFFEEHTAKPDFMLAKADIDIVYEDDNIMLLNKKCGLVVHEDNEGSYDTLINRVLKYLYDKGEYNPDEELSFTPSLCNRIDRNTSGIVICAKNAESLRILNQKIKDRELCKKYLCITIDIPKKKQDRITAYLEKNESTNTVYISDRKTEKNKTIITDYKVLKTNGRLALCEIDLITGRTHQIRAHMAHIGYPLLGDGKYGVNKVNSGFGIKTQALCSYYLRFDFKTDGGILNYLDKKDFKLKDIWFVKEYFG